MKRFNSFSLFFKFLFASLLLLATPVQAQDVQKKLMVFGDSLVAGYGMSLDQAFPAQLEKKLQADGHNIKVINAGVSGDTTSAGVTRLDWALQQNPDYVMVVLGGNDMLRQIDTKVTRENLEKILAKLKEHNIPTLLAGMRAYRNMNDFFGGGFESIFEETADKYDAVYYPFFLDGVALNAQYNLDDGIHPNPAGVGVIVERIYDDVKDLLERKK